MSSGRKCDCHIMELAIKTILRARFLMSSPARMCGLIARIELILSEAVEDTVSGLAHLRRNWPRGGAPRGAPPLRTLSLYGK